MKNLIYSLILSSLIGCQLDTNNKTEKFNKKYDKITSVQKEIVDIKVEINFHESMLYIIDNYLLVFDGLDVKKGIHIFEKNTFKYITSTGYIGNGPGELTLPGSIFIDNERRAFWVADYGKNLIWKFPIDSVLQNKLFKPTVNIPNNPGLLIVEGSFINDSIVFGLAINNNESRTFTKLNVKNNTINEFGYVHPKLDSKGITCNFDISEENNIYIKCYRNYDLMTICKLDGELKCNIYGSEWVENKPSENLYFRGIKFFNNFIIASYSGAKETYTNEYMRSSYNYPSGFLVFNIEGVYIKTIKTVDKFVSFCLDKVNNRIIVCFEDRENPLGYINLNFD